MKIFIEIQNDNGESVWEYWGPIQLPKEFKTPIDRPFRDKKILYYGFTYQPIVKIAPGE